MPDRSAPHVGIGRFLEESQAFEAELPHPTGLALHVGDLLNIFLLSPSLGFESVMFCDVNPGLYVP